MADLAVPRSADALIDQYRRAQNACLAGEITDPALVRVIHELVRAQDDLLGRVCDGTLASFSERRGGCACRGPRR